MFRNETGMHLICKNWKNANFIFLNNYKPNFILNVIFFPVINIFLAFWHFKTVNQSIS